MRAKFYVAALVVAFTLTTSFSATVAHAQERQPVDATMHTEATLRRILEMRFDASPAIVLPQLLTRVDRNVGSRRICVFADGRELVDPLVVYDPPDIPPFDWLME